MNKIKTFEDACEKLGINPEEIKLSYPEGINHHAKAFVAHMKLVIIIEALNDGWKPDWTNGNWDKYYAWFRMGGSSGVGFSFNGCGNWLSHSFVGSRLVFKSADLAKHVGKLFIDDFRDFLIINN